METYEIAGLAVIGVGLLLILVGLVAGWKEAKKRGTLGQAGDFAKGLAEIVKALGGQPTSVVFFTFGTLLVFIGSLILAGGAVF
jgi:hypothetical protein